MDNKRISTYKSVICVEKLGKFSELPQINFYDDKEMSVGVAYTYNGFLHFNLQDRFPNSEDVDAQTKFAQNIIDAIEFAKSSEWLKPYLTKQEA